jgi:multidrug transporter EmrE-like cation transporter
MKLEAIVATLMGTVGTIIMGWSVFAEEAPRPIGYIGLMIFAVGIVLGCYVFAEYFRIIRSKRN